METNAIASSAAPNAGLTLKECLNRVVAHNEAAQMRLIEWQISRKRYQGEKGIFEPDLVGVAQREDNRRANTVEQARSQSLFGTGTVFNQKNDTYNLGVEALQPMGTRVRLGFNLQELHNNLNGALFPAGEYVSSFSLSFTQPLLKNAGVSVTTAGIRLAAIVSEAAFQDYRKQFMQVIAGSEAAYWDLHLAQEQLLLAQESLDIAKTLLSDNRTRLAAGKASELEVLQAQAGVVFRASRRSDAEQKVMEAAGRLASFMGQPATGASSGSSGDQPTTRTTDTPALKSLTITFGDCMSRATDTNPDYLSRRKQIEGSKIRLAYAKNQRWPQLDLKASYGLNGVGGSPASSFDQITRSDFPFWTLGLEMHIPLEGGIKSKADLEAAKLAVQQSLIGLQEVETQLGNAIETALRKARSASANVTNLQALADYTRTVLDAQIDRLNAGKTDSKTVLETEEKLFEARVAVVDSLVQAERARIELDLIQGILLLERDLDLTPPELERRTVGSIQRMGIDVREFTQLAQASKSLYEQERVSNRASGRIPPRLPTR